MIDEKLLEKISQKLEKIIEERKKDAMLLVSKAILVAEEMGIRVPKSHGSFYVYPADDVENARWRLYNHDEVSGLLIIYDDYGKNINVYWNGKEVLNVGSYDTVYKYIPGEWERKIEELYVEAKKMREERELKEKIERLRKRAENWGINFDKLLEEVKDDSGSS